MVSFSFGLGKIIVLPGALPWLQPRRPVEQKLGLGQGVSWQPAGAKLCQDKCAAPLLFSGWLSAGGATGVFPWAVYPVTNDWCPPPGSLLAIEGLSGDIRLMLVEILSQWLPKESEANGQLLLNRW